MIEFNNKEYYSCDEIAKLLNTDYYPDFTSVWCEAFGRSKYTNTSASYVWSKLNNAAIEKKLKHIQFYKKDKHTKFKAYNLDDVKSYLKSTNCMNTKSKGYKDISGIVLVEVAG